MILGEKIKQMYELTYKHIFISQGILIHTPLIHSPIKNGFEKEHCFAACIVSQSNSGIGILQLSWKDGLPTCVIDYATYKISMH